MVNNPSSDNPTPDLLILPNFIIGKEQVQKLLTEVLQIDNFLKKAQNRQPGSRLNLPHTTTVLDEFAEANQRNVINHNQRLELARFLRDVYKFAPEVQLLVSPNGGSSISEGVINWFRQNVHAQTMFKLRPQPQLLGGAAIRIKHKTYDFSLNKRFNDSLPVLVSALKNSNESQGIQSQKRRQY